MSAKLTCCGPTKGKVLFGYLFNWTKNWFEFFKKVVWKHPSVVFVECYLFELEFFKFCELAVLKSIHFQSLFLDKNTSQIKHQIKINTNTNVVSSNSFLIMHFKIHYRSFFRQKLLWDQESDKMNTNINVWHCFFWYLIMHFRIKYLNE